jgi:hypothetical protein
MNINMHLNLYFFVKYRNRDELILVLRKNDKLGKELNKNKIERIKKV